MLVVTLPAGTEPAQYASEARALGAELLELRGDLTPDLLPFSSTLPLLISPRGAGASFLGRFDATYVDLEQDEDLEVPAGAKFIRSFHDYEKTPSADALQKKLEALRPGADIVKVATFVRSLSDLEVLSGAMKKSGGAQDTVILGMGPKAHLSRLLSLRCNPLSYVCRTPSEASAPGQLPLSFCKKLQQAANQNAPEPALFGLLGGLKSASSFSPTIHNTWFSESKVNGLYTVFPTDNIEAAWPTIEALSVQGLSVTAPFKTQVIPFLSEMDPVAEAVQSVNTLVRRNGGWFGTNTDIEGIRAGYSDLQGLGSALILGTGGVVPAVVESCRQLGIARVIVAGRTPDKLKTLGKRLECDTISLEQVKDLSVDVAFCCVSEDVSLPLPSAQHFIDLRYGADTLFLSKAKARGRTRDGLAMLVQQAKAQFELFAGRPPDPKSFEETYRSLRG